MMMLCVCTGAGWGVGGGGGGATGYLLGRGGGGFYYCVYPSVRRRVRLPPTSQEGGQGGIKKLKRTPVQHTHGCNTYQ